MSNQKIKPEMFSTKILLKYMLEETWHKDCEIILDYMPPHPGSNTKPSIVVCYNNGTKYPPYLRYSKGPKQGFGWDIYGDDFLNVELALIALSDAPTPRSVAPITFTIPIGKNAVEDKEIK